MESKQINIKTLRSPLICQIWTEVQTLTAGNSNDLSNLQKNHLQYAPITEDSTTNLCLQDFY